MKPSQPLPGLLVGLAVTIASCASSASPASPMPPPGGSSNGPGARTSQGGQVTVVVTWAGPSAGAVFDVKLDTHSVDLDALDLTDAILRNDRGETLSAEPWAAPKGGHHRAGPLRFRGDTGSFFAGTRWVELVLRGVGDVPERTLRWELTP